MRIIHMMVTGVLSRASLWFRLHLVLFPACKLAYGGVCVRERIVLLEAALMSGLEDNMGHRIFRPKEATICIAYAIILGRIWLRLHCG
jgi:hypothetical protein